MLKQVNSNSNGCMEIIAMGKNGRIFGKEEEVRCVTQNQAQIWIM